MTTKTAHVAQTLPPTLTGIRPETHSTNGALNPQRWQPRPALRDDLPARLSLFDDLQPLRETELP